MFTEEFAQGCSVNKGALRNFTNFTGKHRASFLTPIAYINNALFSFILFYTINCKKFK